MVQTSTHTGAIKVATPAAISVAIAGASGRMGQMLVEAVRADSAFALTGALDIASSPALGHDAGAFAGQSTGVAITADLHAGLHTARC